MSSATIIVKADDGRVIHQEQVPLEVEEERVAPLLAGVGERLAKPRERVLPQRIVAVQSAVGRTFD
jgi:hypothetical protein